MRPPKQQKSSPKSTRKCSQKAPGAPKSDPKSLKIPPGTLPGSERPSRVDGEVIRELPEGADGDKKGSPGAFRGSQGSSRTVPGASREHKKCARGALFHRKETPLRFLLAFFSFFCRFSTIFGRKIDGNSKAALYESGSISGSICEIAPRRSSTRCTNGRTLDFAGRRGTLEHPHTLRKDRKSIKNRSETVARRAREFKKNTQNS